MEIWYTCQQPFLFPPIYIFERRLRCDYWVEFNVAQFDRDGTQYKLGDKNGVINGVVPVKKPRMKPINSVQLNEPKRWVNTLRKQTEFIYGRHEAYQALRPLWHEFLEEVETYDLYHRLCTRAFLFFGEALQLRDHRFLIVDSRALVEERPENPTEWIQKCGEALKATDYIQGTKSLTDYFDPQYMTDFRVWGQEFSIEYEGAGGNTHDASYAIIDLLFTQPTEVIKGLLNMDNPDKSLHGVRHVAVPGQGYRKLGVVQ